MGKEINIQGVRPCGWYGQRSLERLGLDKYLAEELLSDNEQIRLTDYRGAQRNLGVTVLQHLVNEGGYSREDMATQHVHPLAFATAIQVLPGHLVTLYKHNLEIDTVQYGEREEFGIPILSIDGTAFKTIDERVRSSKEDETLLSFYESEDGGVHGFESLGKAKRYLESFPVQAKRLALIMYGQWEGKGLKKLITDAEVLLYRASGEKRPYKMKIQERYDKKIRSIARRIAHSLPDGALLEEGDLHSYGVLGLLDALGKFDLTRPNLFGTYIDGKYGRIEGTIVDALRGVDHATRTERENVKKVRNFERDFRKGNNRDPRRGEIIGGLNVSEQFVSDVSVTRNVSHAPFDGYGGEDDGVRPYNETLTAQSLDTRTNREQSDRSAVLRRALAILTPGEQELVVRYFWKGQKLLEIGDALGVTESRMSQRLTEITNKLGNIADLREVL